MGDDLRDHVAENGGVTAEQFHARLTRFLVDARRHNHDAAPVQIDVIARENLHRVGKGNGVQNVIGFGFSTLDGIVIKRANQGAALMLLNKVDNLWPRSAGANNITQ